MDQDKDKIIKLFNENVRGKKPDTELSNQKHDGKSGHWLERQMGIKANSSNTPDLFGYEMKNHTSSGKITFGDWSADEYIFKSKKNNNINKDYNLTKDDFLRFFGKSNEGKEGRFSWSGSPCPSRYEEINKFGQVLKKDSENNIFITYSYSKDTRMDKHIILPKELQKDDLILARWHVNSIKNKIEKKFNQKGWFTCKKNINGEYESIHFGKPINFDTWLNFFERGIIFFDSGMYQTNSRNYSQWRASTVFWESLIIESY